MSLTLYIVRHGEAYSNLCDKITVDKDSELTIRGKIQAAAAGNEIKRTIRETGIKFDAVYCSPYKRAKETCMIAIKVAHVNKDVTFSPYLRERDYYKLVGQSIKENYYSLQALDTGYLQEHMDAINCNSILSFDKIEKYEYEKKRFRRFMKEVRRKYPNGTILIFTHGLFEQAISKMYTGEMPELLDNGKIRIVVTESESKRHEGSA